MKNVSIAQRITLTLAIALLSMIGVGGYALWGLGAAQSRFEYVQVNSMPSVKVLSEVIFAVKDMRTLIRDHILSEGTSAKNEVARRFAVRVLAYAGYDDVSRGRSLHRLVYFGGVLLPPVVVLIRRVSDARLIAYVGFP